MGCAIWQPGGEQVEKKDCETVCRCKDGQAPSKWTTGSHWKRGRLQPVWASSETASLGEMIMQAHSKEVLAAWQVRGGGGMSPHRLPDTCSWQAFLTRPGNI